MPLGISGTFNYMLVFQAEHNILMVPSTCWESQVSSVVHCSPQCTVHWLPLHWFAKPLETESQNYGYKFGQEEETYNIICSHHIFGYVLSSNIMFNNSVHCTSSSQHGQSWESGLPPSASPPWRLTSTDSTSIKSILDGEGRVLNTWADVLSSCAGLGMEVMHERNAHNFPLDLAATGIYSVALTAPSIG